MSSAQLKLLWILKHQCSKWVSTFVGNIDTTTLLLALQTSWSSGLLAVWISLHKGDIKWEGITRKEIVLF